MTMSWGRNHDTNANMVSYLRENSFASSELVIGAMLATDRGLYTLMNPYEDLPQPIGYYATISAPRMHAFALELLQDRLQEGASALDVGSGSGYLTACLARMVGLRGRVIGVEHIPGLVNDSLENITRDDPSLISSGRVSIKRECGRGVTTIRRSISTFVDASGRLFLVPTVYALLRRAGVFFFLSPTNLSSIIQVSSIRATQRSFPINFSYMVQFPQIVSVSSSSTPPKILYLFLLGDSAVSQT
ncbi:protein-L-isoaspartate(D-aspartate) O-methyltransferase-like isoform X2 [Lampetra fluviatilis]